MFMVSIMTMASLTEFRLTYLRLCFNEYPYLVPERKLSFSPISASDKNFNPQNTKCNPVVKILIFLDLDKKS